MTLRPGNYVAIIVDALRASATAAMLLDAGARELWVVSEVETAREAQRTLPGALLFGERGGLPPEGFDGGNSPRETAIAKDKTVIFTTTTGAGRLVAAWGSHAVYMGTTLNARAVASLAASHGRDVVVIPAGLATDPTFDAQEDWAAGAAVAALLPGEPGEGAERFAHWRSRIEAEGVERLFETAPHSEKLRRVGLDADIVYAAQYDLTTAVPQAVERNEWGVVVRRA